MGEYGTAIGIALAVLSTVVGIAVTWGKLTTKIGVLEKEVAELKSLSKDVTANDARATESAKSQGGRLGTVEDKISKLEGRFDGFERGFDSGRRSRTNAHGHRVPEKAGS
jgi:hypothetical protein